MNPITFFPKLMNAWLGAAIVVFLLVADVSAEERKAPLDLRQNVGNSDYLYGHCDIDTLLLTEELVGAIYDSLDTCDARERTLDHIEGRLFPLAVQDIAEIREQAAALNAVQREAVERSLQTAEQQMLSAEQFARDMREKVHALQDLLTTALVPLFDWCPEPDVALLILDPMVHGLDGDYIYIDQSMYLTEFRSLLSATSSMRMSISRAERSLQAANAKRVPNRAQFGLR